MTAMSSHGGFRSVVITMASEVVNPLLGYGAGALTILSPCVLPLIPVVFGAAAQKHRLAPFVLAGGLVTGFTSVGFILATFGSQIGIDTEQVRFVGAFILAAAGILLLVPQLQEYLANRAVPLITWASARERTFEDQGLVGQLAIGLLLGLVWSPCVGPTLGAATALAAQGEKLSQVAATMAAFGAGIATMLLLIALAGRGLIQRYRSGIFANVARAKAVLGAILLAVGSAILTGVDRALEALLLGSLPDWLIDLTTSV